MRAFLSVPAWLVASMLWWAAPVQALVVDQIDTFEDGTTDGWFAGGLGPPGQVPPTPPQVVADGGPGGPGDAFLQITAIGGGGAGSRLVAINSSQWAGNYLASGIGFIAMDLQNLGPTPLTIRLLFEDPMGGPPQDEAVTTFGLQLPSASGWQHALFPISVADLTALDGSAATVLGQTTLLRIIHAPTASDAARVTGVLGVDNIRAQVPTPGSLALSALGLLALWAGRRRRTGA